MGAGNWPRILELGTMSKCVQARFFDIQPSFFVTWLWSWHKRQLQWVNCQSLMALIYLNYLCGNVLLTLALSRTLTVLLTFTLSALTTVSLPLHRSVHVGQHPEIRTGGYCWSKVLLPACLFFHGEGGCKIYMLSARILLESPLCTDISQTTNTSLGKLFAGIVHSGYT